MPIEDKLHIKLIFKLITLCTPRPYHQIDADKQAAQ